MKLPFGGVGGSGYGCYCGEPGFINFSHQKSVLIKSLGMEFLFKYVTMSLPVSCVSQIIDVVICLLSVGIWIVAMGSDMA